MKIFHIEFSETETAVLYVLAGQALKDAGLSRKEAVARIDTLSPHNIVRLALGFEARRRGGSRKNAGRPKPAKAKKPKPE